MKRTLFILLFAFSLLLAGTWAFRDTILKIVGNQYATAATGLFIQIKDVDTKRLKGLNQFDVKVVGEIAKAPFNFHGTVKAFPLKITKHTLKVSGFPLTAINHRIRRKAGFEFKKGLVNAHSTGSADLKELNLQVNLNLYNFELRKLDNMPLHLQEGLLNFLASRSRGLSLLVQIRGSPLQPEIIWPQKIDFRLNPFKGNIDSLEDISRTLKRLFR